MSANGTKLIFCIAKIWIYVCTSDTRLEDFVCAIGANNPCIRCVLSIQDGDCRVAQAQGDDTVLLQILSKAVSERIDGLGYGRSLVSIWPCGHLLHN